MVAYSIEQLHELFLKEDFDIQRFYDELYKESLFQQKRLNAFVTITKTNPHKEIKQLFDSIPYVLKDNINTKGILTTASSQMLEDYVPVYDAHVVEILKQNKCHLVGKSSMDELGMGYNNQTALTGIVCNPWDSSRIAGGSSGGSSALVGSGLIPFALGSDTGDSIRKPAGYCGVVGMKPTWGRISRYGLIPYASSLDHVGALTRNVKDMALVMEMLSGYDDRDMTSSIKSVPHYRNELNTNIKGLKIAILKNVFDDLKDENIRLNFMNNIQILKRLGAIVEEVSIPNELMEAIIPVYTIIANCEATSNHACLDGIKYGSYKEGQSIEDIMIQSRTYGFSSQIRRRFILGSLALLEDNQEKMFKKAQCVRRLIVDEINKIFLDYDIILTPNSGSIAPLIDHQIQSYEIIENHLCLSNFAGIPSLTLPCGFVENMPIAVNLTGRLFEEQTVLNTAYALEQELGYANQYCREG